MIAFTEEEDSFKRIKENPQGRKIAVALMNALSVIRMLFGRLKKPVFSAHSRPYAFSTSSLEPRPCSFPPCVLIFPLKVLLCILKLMHPLVSSATDFFNRLDRYVDSAILNKSRPGQ